MAENPARHGVQRMLWKSGDSGQDANGIPNPAPSHGSGVSNQA